MDYTNIPIEKFAFADKSRRIGDKKLETKPVSYAKDVWRRFCKNKSSVVAAGIIAFLILFAILVPMFCNNKYTTSLTDTTYLQYTKLLPKSKLLSNIGIWDGCKDETINKTDYLVWTAFEHETGKKAINKVYLANYREKNSNSNTTYYDVKLDSYYTTGMAFMTLTSEQYQDIQNWQNETGIQVIYPAVDEKQIKLSQKQKDPNIWYEITSRGVPVQNADGTFNNIYRTTTKQGLGDDYYSIRVEGDNGGEDGSTWYRYAKITGTSENKGYVVRVMRYNYFIYKYGFEPSFLFGTNDKGQDILTRLAEGARFSLILALGISAVNLFIGAVYGAIQGYYGGYIDLFMDRVLDILGGVPSMVVMSLFQLHLAQKVGPIWSLIFAFILTGWIGMAGRTRMQFYRFKRQEYILSARTLGASDARLIFKHIFPNAVGTLITGSVLSIPGVIFSESSLTYLGIVNLESSTQTSVGTLLAGGNGYLSSFPHIIFFPALFISLLMISFNLFGNGLRDAFNPSLKGVED